MKIKHVIEIDELDLKDILKEYALKKGIKLENRIDIVFKNGNKTEEILYTSLQIIEY